MRTTPEQRAEWARLADECAQVPETATAYIRVNHELRKEFPVLLADLAATKEELEEWRFTNKVDELCRRVDRAEAENATLRQQLAASDAALIESRANDCEAMRQLAEAQARIAELSAMLDHKADEADEAERMAEQTFFLKAAQAESERYCEQRDNMLHDICRALDAWDSSVLEKPRDGRLQESMECLRETFNGIIANEINEANGGAVCRMTANAEVSSVGKRSLPESA